MTDNQKIEQKIKQITQIKKFKLEVLEHNLIAYSLYKKLGFQLKSSYITDNGNSIIMQLDYELRK